MFLTRLGFNAQDGHHRRRHADRPALPRALRADRGAARCSRASPGSASCTSTTGRGAAPPRVRHRARLRRPRAARRPDRDADPRTAAVRVSVMAVTVDNRQRTRSRGRRPSGARGRRALDAVGRPGAPWMSRSSTTPRSVRSTPRFRGIRRRTDVLAFPLEPPAPGGAAGQIVLSAETARARHVGSRGLSARSSSSCSSRTGPPPRRIRRPRSRGGAPDASTRARHPEHGTGGPAGPPLAGALRLMRGGVRIAGRHDPTRASPRSSTVWWATSSPSSLRARRRRAPHHRASATCRDPDRLRRHAGPSSRHGKARALHVGRRSSRAVEEVDLVCLVVDASDSSGPGSAVLEPLRDSGGPCSAR